MNIYFAGSIRGGREDRELYFQLIDYLKQFGTVLTEHVGKKELSLMGEDGLTDRQIHDRDLAWVLNSDVMVAEVTQPSTGVGYEIGIIVNKKPILCLYRKQEGKNLSAMIAGAPGVKNVTYETLNQAQNAIDDFFRQNFPNLYS